MDSAVAIVGAERGILQLVEGESLCVVAYHGHQPAFLQLVALPRTAEIRRFAGVEAIIRGQHVTVEDIEHNVLIPGGIASQNLLRGAGIRAMLLTPLLTRQGTLFGILSLHWSVPHLPDEQELAQLHLLARQAVPVIEHEQSREALKEALRAMSEERRAETETEEYRTTCDMLDTKQGELDQAHADVRAQTQELQDEAEAQRESEQRYRTLFEAALDAIVVHRDGRFLDANDAALRLTGARTYEELAKHTVLDFFRPEDREQAVERMRLAMKGRRLPMREATLVRLDGQQVVVEFHTAPVDVQGVLGIQTIIRDITDRKQAEAALRDLNATLENKVAQRTAELEHRTRQLQKLTLKLSQAEERERRRLAVILHEDLQQQLAGAKFHLSLLYNGAKSDPSEKMTAAEINRVLRDVIGMSRDLSHELSPAVFYGNDLAEALEWLAEHVEAKQGLTVQVDACGKGTLESEWLTIFLFRAANELLSNVIQHAGVREAKVRLRRLGRYVGLCVSDQGDGFDPQELKETPGFGLLGIREHAELLGGRMTIKAAKGKGSTLRIVIPDGR